MEVSTIIQNQYEGSSISGLGHINFLLGGWVFALLFAWLQSNILHPYFWVDSDRGLKQKRTRNMVIIGGRSFKGDVVVFKNGRVIVDGEDVTPENESEKFNITIEGNVGSIEVDRAKQITINGSVEGNVASGSGDVSVTYSVSGNVTTGSGDVSVSGNVSGDVRTGSGDVDCSGTIGGSVKTGSGDISHKK